MTILSINGAGPFVLVDGFYKVLGCTLPIFAEHEVEAVPFKGQPVFSPTIRDGLPPQSKNFYVVVDGLAVGPFNRVEDDYFLGNEGPCGIENCDFEGRIFWCAPHEVDECLGNVNGRGPFYMFDGNWYLPGTMVKVAPVDNGDFCSTANKRIPLHHYRESTPKPGKPVFVGTEDCVSGPFIYEEGGFKLNGKVAITVRNFRMNQELVWCHSHDIAASDTNLEDEPVDPGNPKDAIGSQKVPMSVVPPRVLLEVAAGMLEGGIKYGKYNYRATNVRSSIYYDAALRHLMSWYEGEDIDPKSGIHHVSKAISSLVVLRDALMGNRAIDDRPPSDGFDIEDLNRVAQHLIGTIPDCGHHYDRHSIKEREQ